MAEVSAGIFLVKQSRGRMLMLAEVMSQALAAGKVNKPMRLGELVFHLARRRRLYLPDDRFASLVSLLVGFDLASESSPLGGFQEWVAARLLGRYSNHVWYWILVSEKLGSDARIDDLPADTNLELIALTLELLTAFAEEKGEPVPASLNPPGAQ